MILDVEEFLTPTSAVAGVLEGFEERLEQKRMAAAVSGALASGQHLLVEAGTGTGKSFAYLLPALKRVVEQRERILISTNTINLQEQLCRAGHSSSLEYAVRSSPCGLSQRAWQLYFFTPYGTGHQTTWANSLATERACIARCHRSLGS